MAIMVVYIEDIRTLRMNEFFDYNGWCWALSRSRHSEGALCAELEDFYECTVQSRSIDDVPVIFVKEGEAVGWYARARVYRNLHKPALFLEGNIQARTSDAVLLARPVPLDMDIPEGGGKSYIVCEEDDSRYGYLMDFMKAHEKEKVPIACAQVNAKLGQEETRRFRASHADRKKYLNKEEKLREDLALCRFLAETLMTDACEGIGSVKLFYETAKKIVRSDGSQVDGWYYLAMASEQLGFIREGLKAIERALKQEPEGDDLLAMKGNLLTDAGRFEAALECYEKAWKAGGDDEYLVMAGKACEFIGDVDAAYKYYERVPDKELLDAYGVSLKAMERRWPFVSVRGLRTKSKKRFGGSKE